MQQAGVERREQTRDHVLQLLEERQHMLVSYCELAGLDPYVSSKPVEEKLRSFCQKLVDYLATGHFTIYDRIENGNEYRSHVLEVAREVMPGIEDTTDISVAFNDKYDESDHALQLDYLASDMDMLGESLGTRADYEDRLINALI
jgi:regulator of sigma D